MAGATVSAAPYAGLVNNSNTAHNAAVGQYGIAINSHDHDPSDTTNGYGAGIPQWGPTNTLYPTHGPGASGTDWTTNYASAAAIPADPNETALAPSGTIAASAGIAAELQRIRGAINVLYGAPAAQGWNTTQPPSSAGLVHTSPLSADVGSINVTASITGSQLNSNVGAGTPPLTVASTDKVVNLNADLLDGLSAVATYGGGSGGSLLALNGAGLYDAAAVAADGGSSTPVGTPVTVADSLANIRAQIALWSTAAGLGGGWTTAPTSLVSGVAASGSPFISGQVTLAAGTGIALNQTGGTIALAFSGTAPAAGDSVTFSDFFSAAVLSGLASATATGTTMATGFAIQAGTGYIPNSGGNSRKATTATYTITNATGAGHQLSASSDNYIDWTGADALTAFVVTAVAVNAAAPALASGSMRLYRVRTDATTITAVLDLRPLPERPGKRSWLNILDFANVQNAASLADWTGTINQALKYLFFNGGGTLFFPAGVYVCNGQIAMPHSGTNGLMGGTDGTQGQQPSIAFVGVGNGWASGAGVKLTSGSILDLRWDGGNVSTTYNQYPNDWAVVNGLQIKPSGSLGPTANSTAFSFIGPNPAKVYMGANAAGAAPTSITATLGTFFFPTTGNILAQGVWYIDVSATGAIYATQSAFWTDTTASGSSVPVYSLPGGAVNPVLQTFGVSATPNTIRVAAVWLTTIGGNLRISAFCDMRSKLSKIDTRGYGSLQAREMAFIRGDTPTTDDSPFIRSTVTSLLIDACSFQGSKRNFANTIASPSLQDAIVIGGPGSPGQAGGTTASPVYLSESGTAASAFGGYSVTISRCNFSQIKRAIWARANGSGIAFRDNVIWTYCSADQYSAAVHFEGSTNGNRAYGNWVIGNLFETTSYPFVIRASMFSGGHTMSGNNFSDAENAGIFAAVNAGDASFQLATRPLFLANTVQWLNQQMVIDNNVAGTETITIGAGPITGGDVSGAITATGVATQYNITVSAQGAIVAGSWLILNPGQASQETVAVSGAYAGGTNVLLSQPLTNSYTAVPVGIISASAPITIPLSGTFASHHNANAVVTTTIAFHRYDTTNVSNMTVMGGSYSVSPAVSDLSGQTNHALYNAYGQTSVAGISATTLTSSGLTTAASLSVTGTSTFTGAMTAAAVNGTQGQFAAAGTVLPVNLGTGALVSATAQTQGRLYLGASGGVSIFNDNKFFNFNGLPPSFNQAGAVFLASPSFGDPLLAIGAAAGLGSYTGPPAGALLAFRPSSTFGTYAAPPPLNAAAAAGTGLSIGFYAYVYTYTTAAGETVASPPAYVYVTSGNQQVNLTAINVGPASPNAPTGRKIYRSKVNVLATLFLLPTGGTIADNTTTTLTDTNADTALTGQANPPATSTAGSGYQGYYIDCTVQGGATRFSVDQNGVAFASGLAPIYTSVTGAAYTVSVRDSTIVVNVASAVITLPAPSAVPVGRKYSIKNNNRTTTTIKTNAAGVLIDGVDYSTTGLALNTAYGVLRIFTDGTNWLTE